MDILIRKEPDGTFYIDGNVSKFESLRMDQPPYNFTKVTIPDTCKDFKNTDFNDDLSFSMEKYNARKLVESNLIRIGEIQKRLTELSQDFIQATAGAVFEDITARIQEFQKLHNELRSLQGKEPRVYI